MRALGACRDLGGWGAGTKIAGAVVAPGSVVIEKNRQVIQHSEGGTVDEVIARDGDLVASGDVLLRLEDTLISTELHAIESRLVELRARRARLVAERDGLQAVYFPKDLLADIQSPRAVGQIQGQQALFGARHRSVAQEQAQLTERIRQTTFRIAGLNAQLGAFLDEERLVKAELEDQSSLLGLGLVQKGRVTDLKRAAVEVAGAIGQVRADIAALKGEGAALEIEKLRLVSERREAAIATLRDIGVDEVELERQRVVLKDRLSRTEVRSPVSGIVCGSSVFGEGAVLRAAEPLMYIVPQDQPLLVSVRVSAGDVDQVRLGQKVTLRFPTFNQRTTPEVSGVAISVSADAFIEERTAAAYYEVEVAPEIEELASVDLVPGMPVEAYLRTDLRTPLSYLIKPLADYFNRALREK